MVAFGDDPHLPGRSGVWASARDQRLWRSLATGARTLAAAALALYLVGDRAIPAVWELTRQARFEKEEWDDGCFVSGEGGNIMCCETCPRTMLPECMGLTKAPKGDFLCNYCLRRQRGDGALGAEPVPGATAAARRGAEPAGARGRAADQGSRKARAPSRAAEDVAKSIERLQKSASKHGLFNGSICEVRPNGGDGERQFVLVQDGTVAEPGDGRKALGKVQWLTPWRPREGKPMVPEQPPRKVPLFVEALISVGRGTELVLGDAKTGYRPKY